MSLIYVQNHFNTPDKCYAHMEKLRWGGTVTCAHCGNTASITKRANTHIYHCNACNSDFTVIVGTIFEHSRLPMPKWFMLITLVMDAKKGIASTQISRNLDMSYRSAWYSAMRLRCAMVEDIELDGTIEGDESLISWFLPKSCSDIYGYTYQK